MVPEDANSSDGVAYQVTAPSGLKLRVAAVTGSVLAVIPTGAQVNVLSITSDWAKVTYNGLTGYCSAVWLTKE